MKPILTAVFAVSVMQVISLVLVSSILYKLNKLSARPECPPAQNILSETYSDSKTKKRALIIYAYVEKNMIYQKTLDYFIKIGVQESSHIDYLFVIQGYNVSIPIPTHFKNVHVIKRENTGYDLGAYGKGIEQMGGIDQVGTEYEYFILINPSASGPILPKYWPENTHWTEIFFSRFKNNVHAVGASMSCNEVGPYLDGWFVALSYRGLLEAYKVGAFECHKTKIEAVEKGEYGLSKAIINAGLNIDSLLLKYSSQIDWRNKALWSSCQDSPMYKNAYTDDNGRRLNVHPLETVFFKPTWLSVSKDPLKPREVISEMYQNDTLAYMEWAIKRHMSK